MSDSDDTDTLLLVPPNLFSVPSESDGNPESSVVGDLISHVERLETRVNNIEHRTSLLGSADFVHSGSNEEVSLKSAESSSGRTLPTVLPNGDFCEDPDRNVLLSEVDRYLDSVNFPEMDNQFETDAAASKASSNILDKIASGKHLALPDVDKLLKEMESTQNEIEQKLRARECEYGIGDLSSSQQNLSRIGDRDFTRSRTHFQYESGNRIGNGGKSDFISSRKAFIFGENVGSVPDLGLGVRELYHTKTTSPGKSDGRNPVEEPMARRDAYLVGSSSTGEDLRNSVTSSFSRSPARSSPQRIPLNLETRKPKLLSPRRRLPFSENAHASGSVPVAGLPTSDSLSSRNVHIGTGDTNEFTSERFRSDRPAFQPKLAEHFRGNWLSLADLWKTDNPSLIDDPSKLRQKLEEEKVRRTHLEETVQSLNKRVLEEHEKLAVAMVVDEGKDKAIVQITEAWKQMVEHWKKIEADRHSMSQKLITEKTALKKAREEVDKKIERWEKEVSQALDLAAGYKSKCEFLESEFTVNKEVSEGKIKDLEENLKVKEKTLTDLLEERKILSEKLQDALEQNEEEKRQKYSAQKGIDTLQENLTKTEAELAIVKEQKELIDLRLKEEKSRVAMLEQQRRNLESDLEESRSLQLKAEEEARTAIAELESSKAELRSVYQNQLEVVVRSKLTEFQGQLDAAQLAMQAEIDSTKELAQKRAEEQHNALVNSHVTEIRRLEAIHKDELRSLELKLADSERRRLKLENNHKEIAQKLHGVMENQWQQALTILTSELSTRQPEQDLSRVQTDRQKVFLGKPSRLDSESSDDHPFNKDDLITCRSTNSRPPPAGKQEQLMKYIQMLLNKTPGKAVESSSMFDSSFSGIEAHPEHAAFPQHPQGAFNSQVGPHPDPNIPVSQNKKPPWKPT